MKNKEKMVAYKIFKIVLGPLYKLWYNPKITGKENIPLDGPIILAGNHVHIMDQCNVVVSTKRCIHYMAKKEYFDKRYKEGKFGWFFRSAGCIPVDRTIHDDNAKSAAIQVLKNNEALGLFPEGTRNGLKEARIKELYDKYTIDNTDFETFKKGMKNNKASQINYLEKLIEQEVITEKDFIKNIYNVDDYLKKLIKNKKITKEDYYNNILLPFKFGAVSMAQKTDAYIVPFVITGQYKFRSKNLRVKIGEPFKVPKDKDLAEYNKKLEKTMQELIKENLENSEK